MLIIEIALHIVYFCISTQVTICNPELPESHPQWMKVSMCANIQMNFLLTIR